MLKPWRRIGSGDLAGVAGFGMHTIQAGANLIVMQARPDAAKMVADAIERESWPEVAGIIAGDDTFFIATQNEVTQQILFILLGTTILEG